MKQQKQQGFLSLITIFIITLFTLLSAGLAYLFISRVTANNHMLSNNRAFYMATSGVEQGRYVLNNTTLSSRSSCAGLSQNFNINNSSAAVSGSFVNQTNSLDGAINSTATSMTVDDSSNLSNTGRIYVDKEAIDYKSNDTSSNQLSGLSRGQAGTLASSHANFTVVSQFQCYIQSIGTSPTTNIGGRASINMANQSQTAVSVGNSQRLIQWNHPNNELNWQNMSGSSNNVQYNAVSLLNAHQGFAVGNTSGSNFSINQLEQGSWSSSTFSLSGITSQNLNGVSTVSDNDAWAVGDLDGTTTILLHWDGSSWGNGTNSGTSTALNDVDMVDTTGDGVGNFGFAVGNTSGGSSTCATDFYQCYGEPTDLATCQNYVNTRSCYTLSSSSGKCDRTDDKDDYLKCIDDNDESKCQKYIEDCTAGNGADSTDTCANNYYECQSNDSLTACQTYISASTCYKVRKTNGDCDTSKKKKDYYKCMTDDKENNCQKYLNKCTENIINNSGGSSEGSILTFDGTNWTDSTVNNASNITTLNSVSIIDNGSSTPVDAFTAGESSSSGGIILQWDGSAWSSVLTPTQIMHSISMIDTTGNGSADYGWVVGDNGNAYEFNNGSWSSVQTIAGGNDLYSVRVLSRTDAWVVGASGARYHWNGSNWTQTEGGVSTSDTLRGIDVPYRTTLPSTGWSEMIS